MTEKKRYELTFDDKIKDKKNDITYPVHSGYDVAHTFVEILNDYECYNRHLEKENEKLQNRIDKLEGRLIDNGLM